MMKDKVLYGSPVPIPTPIESTGWVFYQRLIKYGNDDKVFVSNRIVGNNTCSSFNNLTQFN